MDGYRTVLTRKGQVTVPADIRRALGLKQGDIVAISLEDGTARLAPVRSVTERTAGMFRMSGAPPTAEELRDAAEIAMAQAADPRDAD